MIPKGIVLHLSASSFGDAAQIDQWHKANGWSGIGYHFVILNGRRHNFNPYKQELDGVVEVGRPENLMGAHCKANGINACTLGICSIGNPNQIIGEATQAPSEFVKNKYLTNKQLNSLIYKTAQLCIKYGLNPAGNFIHPSSGVTHPVITQHSQHDTGKPLCASLNINSIRQAIITQYQSFSSDFDSIVSDLENAFLVNDPELIENNLPEFQLSTGGSEGPNDLEIDVHLEPQPRNL